MTFRRLKKIIEKGLYIKEELLSDFEEYISFSIITEQEKALLLALVEQHPPIEMPDNTSRSYANNSIYNLLEKSIRNKTYSLDAISQMVSDFKITSTINKSEFDILVYKIKEAYDLLPKEETIPEDIVAPDASNK